MLPVTDQYTCPTCSHTLARLCIVADSAFAMCERCGTIRVTIADVPEAVVYVPKLVERCRRYAQTVLTQASRMGLEVPAEVTASEWVRLGIAESIDPPGARLHPE